MEVTEIRRTSLAGAGGVDLAVLSTGDRSGRPIVFMHGLTQSSVAWTRQLTSDLAAEHHLVAFDFRGHGASGKPGDGYRDSKTWADDVRAVIEGMGLERPLLVGWSYAGLVVCDYLRHYGDQDVSGINLVGAANRVGSAAANRDLGADAVPPGFLSDEAEECVVSLSGFIRACTYAELPAPEFSTFLGFNVQTPPRVRAAMLERLEDNDDVLAAISVPVLISHGEEDVVVLPASPMRVATVVPHCELSWYSGVGHCPFWEDSERFNTELRAFAARCVEATRV